MIGSESDSRLPQGLPSPMWLPEHLTPPTRSCRVAARLGARMLPVLDADIISLEILVNPRQLSKDHGGPSSGHLDSQTQENKFWLGTDGLGYNSCPVSPEAATPSAMSRMRLFWVRMYLNDIASWSWVCTAAILVLEEAIRSRSVSEESIVRDLVAELRFLRHLLAVIENKGCSTLLALRMPLPSGELGLPISHQDAEMILRRRLRNQMACYAAAVTPSGTHLRLLLQHAAEACAHTTMRLSKVNKKKLETTTNRIATLVLRIDFEECLVQLHTESELVSEIISVGCNFQSSLPTSLPPLPAATLQGPLFKLFPIDTLLWDLSASLFRVSLGSKDGTNGKADGMAQFKWFNDLHPHLNVVPTYEIVGNGSVVAAIAPLPQNALEGYLRKNPDADRLRLLKKASTALAHVHLYNGRPLPVPTLKSVLVSATADVMLLEVEGLARLVQEGPLPFVIDDRVVAYVPPEVLRGALWSRQSDVFAFGMMCFHAYLDPDRPCWPLSPDNTRAAFARGERPDRKEITRPDFTDDMWALVQRCWAQEPEERPTMAEVDRLLCAMAKPEHADQYKMDVLYMRVFPPDDEALQAHHEAQRKSKYVRETLQEIERQGLKKFIAEVLEQNGCPELVGLLQEARAEGENLPSRGPSPLDGLFGISE